MQQPTAGRLPAPFTSDFLSFVSHMKSFFASALAVFFHCVGFAVGAGLWLAIGYAVGVAIGAPIAQP